MKLAYPESREMQIEALAVKNPLAFGCTLTGGVIKHALGAETFTGLTPEGLVCAHMLQSGEGLAYMADGSVYKISGANFAHLTYFAQCAAKNPLFVEMQNDAASDLLFCGDSACVLLRNGICSFTYSFPSVSCAAVRCGRVFCADAQTGLMLKWSGEGDILDWDDGISGSGYLHAGMRGGKIVRLFDFGGELVALRESGITRFAVNGTPESFRVTETLKVTGNILPDTAAAVGDKLFFCCDNEILFYSRGKVEKAECPMFDDAQSYKKAYSTKGRYYLLHARSKNLKRYVVYLYDALLGEGCYIDIAPESIVEDPTSLIFYTADYGFRLSPRFSHSIELGPFDFGTPKRKLLTEIAIDCDNKAYVALSNGTSTVNFSSGGIYKLGMRGSSFSVTATGEGEVRSIKLKAEVRK